MNYSLKVAIDLSTTTSGIAIKKFDYPIETHVIDTTQAKDVMDYVNVWEKEIVNHLIRINYKDCDTVLLGIELANFSNPKLTQKFSFIAGIICALFNDVFKNCYFPALTVKLFNSNEWQRLIGCKTTDERNIRKQKAKDYYIQNTTFQKQNITQDEIDAWCILNKLEQLKTTDEQAEYTKQKKQTKIQKLQKLNRLQNKKYALNLELERLDDVKNKRRIQTVLKELDKVNGEIKCLM